MDIDVYKHYLKSNGRLDLFAENEIRRLAQFENDLQIDLDDFIPYNKDYSLCDKLMDMMTEEMKNNEPLWFAINRYMAFKVLEAEA